MVILSPEEERASAEPESADDTEIFSEHVPTGRLRLVAFGTADNVSFSEDELDGVIPPEVVSITGVRSWRDRRVHARVSGAEAYALRLGALLPLLLDEGVGADGAVSHFVKREYRAYLPLMSGAQTGTVRLDLISEVIYARSLDISVSRRGSSGDDDPLLASELEPDLPASADEKNPGSDDGNDPEVPASIAAPPATATDVPSDHAIDPGLGAYARAAAINDVLIEANTADTPSGAVRIISATEDSILIRRIFRRGVAIAVRGLTLQVDAETGEVLKTMPLGRVQ